MSRIALGYPALFSAAFVLSIAARSAGQYRWGDLAVVTLACVSATLLLVLIAQAVARVVSQRAGAVHIASAMAMLAVAWFFYYMPLQRTVELLSYRLSRDVVLLPIGLVATGAAIVWLWQRKVETVATLTTLMWRFGLVLCGLSVVQLLFNARSTPSSAARTGLMAELGEPLPVQAMAESTSHQNPDVYLIVLDGHANSRVLQETFGFDNSAFDDSLRALGFTVPREVHSNYTQTLLSLASLLNASHVTQLTDDLGPRNTDHSVPGHLIAHNRVARFLQARGYRYVFFPSAWFPQTEYSPIADSVFDARPEFRLEDELRRTELRMAAVNSTPLRLFKRSRVDTMFHRRTLDGVRGLARDTRPTFAFAHILIPHIPYFVDRECHALAKPMVDTQEEDTPEQRAAYVEQLQCIDRLLLETVTHIVRESERQPIILLVGDHGTRFSDVRYYTRPESVSTAFARERFGALGAFLLPGDSPPISDDTVTLVNAMRSIMSHYFGADLPRVDDHLFVSGEYPYQFHRVELSSLNARD